MLILKKLSASIRKKSAGTRKDNKTLKVNHNFVGALLTYSAKSGKVIDLEKALINPLSYISLSISKGDGTRLWLQKVSYCSA